MIVTDNEAALYYTLATLPDNQIIEKEGVLATVYHGGR